MVSPRAWPSDSLVYVVLSLLDALYLVAICSGQEAFLGPRNALAFIYFYWSHKQNPVH